MTYCLRSGLSLSNYSCARAVWLSQEPTIIKRFVWAKWPSKSLSCPDNQLAVSVRCPCRDRTILPTTCLLATGLLFFKLCNSVELNKIVEATASVSSYDNNMAASSLRSETAWKGRYGHRPGAVNSSQAKCKLDICAERALFALSEKK